MTRTEFNKIKFCRCPTTKKTLLKLLSAYFDYSIITDSGESFDIPIKYVLPVMDKQFTKLVSIFGMCDYVEDNKLKIFYHL